MDKSRQMVYPYNLTAKIAHFPYKYYWKYSVTFKYFIIAAGIATPVFIKMHSLVNSPGNVALWEEKRRKEHEDHLKHQAHLL